MISTEPCFIEFLEEGVTNTKGHFFLSIFSATKKPVLLTLSAQF